MTKRVITWLVANALFGACVWYGIVEEQRGPLNLLRVWVGVEFVLCWFCALCLTPERAKEIPPPITPAWLRTVRPWVQGAYGATFAWFGHFALAVGYLAACLAWSVVQQRLERVHGVKT